MCEPQQGARTYIYSLQDKASRGLRTQPAFCEPTEVRRTFREPRPTCTNAFLTVHITYWPQRLCHLDLFDVIGKLCSDPSILAKDQARDCCSSVAQAAPSTFSTGSGQLMMAERINYEWERCAANQDPRRALRSFS